MIDFISNKISGKSILILGFGREGKSTYALLRKHFPNLDLTIADQNDLSKSGFDFGNAALKCGADYLSDLNQYDLIFKTPGISFARLPYSLDRKKITSQTDLFLEYFSEQVIGVTGTKGKSTTSSLIFHIAKSHSENTLLVGNIGRPAFDEIANINKNTLIIFELSSHQLEFITKGPRYAVLLNLFQEHLDHHGSFKAYTESKFNIARFQEKTGFFIYNGEDLRIKELIEKSKPESTLLPFSLTKSFDSACYAEDGNICLSLPGQSDLSIDIKGKLQIRGDHNLRNAMVAAIACKLAGIPETKIGEGLKSFQPLEHRMERVGEFNGIIFYNDSIATIPEATIEAVNTLKPVDTLILGGFDRGIDYDCLIDFVAASEIKNVVLLGKVGERLLIGLKALPVCKPEIITANDLEEAVYLAKEKTRKGGVCLLSPAAASYDSFKNFEERGNIYKKIVRDLRTLTNS